MIQITQQEYSQLKKAHDRYEKLRKLNQDQFTKLWMQNIESGKPFDKIVDELTEN